jgi:DNA helicase HerA-like ATPase
VGVTETPAAAIGLERFRAVREELERSVLPRATSLEGRSFTFQASLHGLTLRPGSYVALGDDRLGQILALRMDRVEGAAMDVDEMRAGVPLRLAAGEGAVLDGDGAPFHDAPLRSAELAEIEVWTAGAARVPLPIGSLATAPGVAAAVDARGFDRHTFVCGQSGSGKTYALGVLLEQLLVGTGLRIVVLDPNSDFVRLGEARPGVTGYAPEVDVHTTAVVDPARRCVVIDLGALATQTEQQLVAATVLEALWRRREDRNPVLVVIDEAHNVCPARPDSELSALATDGAIRIAAEGRKFGMYLLACSQRPQKVHENVLTQMDNLVLMRLNSSADTAFAQSAFSFAPAGLVAEAPGFRLGEALVAGKLAAAPTLVRFGARLSEEGGGDVPATWLESPDPLGG